MTKNPDRGSMFVARCVSAGCIKVSLKVLAGFLPQCKNRDKTGYETAGCGSPGFGALRRNGELEGGVAK